MEMQVGGGAIMSLHVSDACFQSAMFDKEHHIVGYDTKRGEKRGPRSLKQKNQKT